MADMHPDGDNQARYLPRERFAVLLTAMKQSGYRCIGPVQRDGAIVLGPLDDVGDLPQGVSDRHAPGEYRIVLGNDARYFAWAVGPQALKPHLFASREVLWRAVRRADGGIEFVDNQPDVTRVGIIGARACDLAALRLQDQHFLEGPHPDPLYAARRRNLFLVAVNCSHPAATCFCVSTGDGPHAAGGYDLGLTELDDGFVVRSGSESGHRLLEALALPAASDVQLDTEREQAEHAAAAQFRRLPGRNLQWLTHKLGSWHDQYGRSGCVGCGRCITWCPVGIDITEEAAAICRGDP